MTDDVAAGLIDALTHEGEHVDDGRFTLDAAAAYRKLREHQFAEPHGYLLLLVEAAWLAGRGRKHPGVTLDIGTATTVAFTGLTLEVGALHEIFGAVLGKLDKLDGEALRRAQIVQLLGLAATSALALKPTHIFIEATDEAGRGHGIRIDASGDITDDPSPSSRPGTIWFQLCGRWQDAERPAIERSLVLQRCRYSSLPIHVDGERVALGPGADLRDDPATTTPVNYRGEPIGVAGHTREYDTPTVAWIVNRGVAIRDPIPNGHRGKQAVVEVDLAMDLSRSKLVEDAALEAIRAGIRVAITRLPTPEPPVEIAEWPTKRLLHVLAVFATLGVIVLVLVSTRRSTPTPTPERDDPSDCRTGSLEACTRVWKNPASSHRARMEALYQLCHAGDPSACAALKPKP